MEMKEKMTKTLYVSDLDGTLLNSNSIISPTTATLLNEAISSGALFTIATARTPATVSQLMRDVKLTLPTIVMTGTMKWNRDENSYHDVRFMPETTYQRFFEVFRKAQLPVFIYTLVDDLIHIYHIGKLLPNEKIFINERCNNPYKRFHLSTIEGIDELPPRTDNILLFYSMSPTEESEKVWKELKALNEPAIINYYHDLFGPEIGILEAFSPIASKATAVNELAKSVGAERIVAFGDNVNDLPMLRAATLSVAPSNAIDEVKQTANVVIESNDTDAVAKFILNDYKSHHRS
jgi:hypothetical protein